MTAKAYFETPPYHEFRPLKFLSTFVFNQISSYNFLGAVADTVHALYPLHLICGFECFGCAFPLSHLLGKQFYPFLTGTINLAKAFSVVVSSERKAPGSARRHRLWFVFIFCLRKYIALSARRKVPYGVPSLSASKTA